MTGRFATCIGALLLAVLSPPAMAARSTLTVAYAGSMGVVMDRDLGPSFAQSDAVRYRGIGRGSWGLARLLVSGRMSADVFISVTPGPMTLLIKRGLVKRAVPVASTEMVIAYSPKSRYAKAFAAAARGGRPWYAILEQPGVRFGRTDPAVDPQGRNIIFTFLLAQRYYKQPGLTDKVLKGYRNPAQIFTEASLLSRLESGQIDATSGYLSAVISHHLPYIKLPDPINLSNPKYVKRWYSTAHFTIKRSDGKSETLNTQPLVFYAGVLGNARNPALAGRFIAFLQSARGQKMLRSKGYSRPKGGPLP